MGDALEDLVEKRLGDGLGSSTLASRLDGREHDIVKSQKRKSCARVHSVTQSGQLGVEN